MLETTRSIDWLGATLPASYALKDTLPSTLMQERLTPLSHGMHGYRAAMRTESGALILFGSADRMGIHVQLSGDALSTLRIDGHDDRLTALFYHNRQAKASRLDLALDLYGSAIQVANFVTCWNEGTLRTPAKTAMHVHNLGEPGETLYLGSKDSDRRARIYDKAAEKGLADLKWLRVEIQYRNAWAKALLKALAVQDNTSAVINGAVDDMVHINNADWIEAVAEQSNSTPEVPRNLPNTLAWLDSQVIPAMVNYQIANPGVNLLAWLTQNYETALAQASERSLALTLGAPV